MRGIYLETPCDTVYENVPESSSRMPEPPMKKKPTTMPYEVIKQTQKVDQNDHDIVAERLATLVGEKHVPYKSSMCLVDDDEKLQEEEEDILNTTDEKEQSIDIVKVGNDAVTFEEVKKLKLDCLEKVLLAESADEKLEIPRSSDSYAMPPLETMRLEQTVKKKINDKDKTIYFVVVSLSMLVCSLPLSLL